MKGKTTCKELNGLFVFLIFVLISSHFSSDFWVLICLPSPNQEWRYTYRKEKARESNIGKRGREEQKIRIFLMSRTRIKEREDLLIPTAPTYVWIFYVKTWETEARVKERRMIFSSYSSSIIYMLVFQTDFS